MKYLGLCILFFLKSTAGYTVTLRSERIRVDPLKYLFKDGTLKTNPFFLLWAGLIKCCLAYLVSLFPLVLDSETSSCISVHFDYLPLLIFFFFLTR